MDKCADCGFLAVRHHFERYLVEVEGNIREGGEWPVQRGTNISLYEKRPLCLMYQKIGGKDGDYSAREFKEAICAQRDCMHFCAWQQGFTPKEHREMIDRQWERKWRIITGIIFVVLAGLFTLLGAYIANLN